MFGWSEAKLLVNDKIVIRINLNVYGECIHVFDCLRNFFWESNYESLWKFKKLFLLVSILHRYFIAFFLAQKAFPCFAKNSVSRFVALSGLLCGCGYFLAIKKAA